jgi:hypothetical protein
LGGLIIRTGPDGVGLSSSSFLKDSQFAVRVTKHATRRRARALAGARVIATPVTVAQGIITVTPSK